MFQSMVLYFWWKETNPQFSKHLQTMSGWQVEIAVVPEILDVQFFPIQVDSTLLLAEGRSGSFAIPFCESLKCSHLQCLVLTLEVEFWLQFSLEKMSLTPSTEFLRCFPSFLRQSDQSWPCYVVDTLWQQRANVVLGTQLGQVLPLSPSSNQWFLISRQWIHWSSFLPTSFPYKVFVMVDIISRDSRALADCRHRWCQTSAKGIFQIHLIPVIDEALNAVKRVF